MDLDALLHHYFGRADLENVPAADLRDGQERLLFDFHDERDAGRRFALWTLMFVVGTAPDPADAFATEDERRAARLFAEAAGGV